MFRIISVIIRLVIRNGGEWDCGFMFFLLLVDMLCGVFVCSLYIVDVVFVVMCSGSNYLWSLCVFGLIASKSVYNMVNLNVKLFVVIFLF